MSKVLLADDSTHAQRMGTQIFKGEGIDVVTVSNGEAAAKKLPGGNFDLVLADVFMPGRTGYEASAPLLRTARNSATSPWCWWLAGWSHTTPTRERMCMPTGC